MSVISRFGSPQQAALWEPADAYDRAAASYDSWHWQKVWRAAEHDFVETTLRTHHRPLSVLDVGCGTGTLLGQVRNFVPLEAKLVGIDISAGMLARALEKFSETQIEFIHGDFLKSTFLQRSFDVIFMCRVASHIADLSSCFWKISSLLRTGGIFAFSDVYSGYPYECTKLPFPEGKISVVTHKHQLPTIVRVAYENSLIVTSVKTCSVSGLPRELRLDPELPRTLIEQLATGLDVPFGCQMKFSLSTQPPANADAT